MHAIYFMGIMIDIWRNKTSQWRINFYELLYLRCRKKWLITHLIIIIILYRYII